MLKPVDVVKKWVDAFNARDADDLANIYHEDSINHQVAKDPVEGREAIRKMFEQEFAATKMVCIPEVIHDAGDIAILEWKDPKGLRGCGFFTVQNGRITFQRGYWGMLSFLTLYGQPGEENSPD